MRSKQRYVSIPTENLWGRVGISFPTLQIITWDIQIIWNCGARGMCISPAYWYPVPVKRILFSVKTFVLTGDGPVVAFSHFAPLTPPVYA